MTELPSGAVTFLFTDVEGSTRLLKQLRDRYAEVLAEHGRLLREAFVGYGGRVVDTQGDALFVAFTSGRSAVLAAVDAQRALAEHEWPEGVDVRVRMGIHTGQASASDDHYTGVAVHRAARISAAGHGGQVLVSQTTHNLLEDEEHELPGIDLRDLGEHWVKDLDRPVRLFEVVAPGLRTDFPPIRTETPPVAPHNRRRRTIMIGALAGVIAAAVALPVFALGGRGGEARAALGATPGSAIGVLDPSSGEVKGSVETPAAPTALAVGHGYVWAASSDANSVFVIDPTTNTVRDTIEVENAPAGITVGGDWVWVTNSLSGTVSQISLKDFSVVNTISVGNGPTGIAAGGGYVWVANTSDHTVSKLRVADGKVVDTFPTGSDPGAVAFGEGALWVASKLRGTLVKLSPASGDILDTIPVGEGPGAVAVGAGSVWVANALSGTITQIDPRTGRERNTSEFASGADAVAVDGTNVWVAGALGGTVSGVGARDGDVTRIEGDHRPTALLAGGGRLFVGLRPGGGSHVGGTLRIVYPDLAPPDIDPATAYNPEAWGLLVMTNDGLVGWRRVGGQAGVELVPDLAVSLPSVSDDGLSYTFQLRRGIRYSDGRLVKASDVRSSLERVYKLRPTREPAAVAFYSSIVGAATCIKRPSRCDLSRGIATDDVAGTVVFHLSRADPEFLFKLTVPFAYFLPSGTRPRRAVQQPLPATGPYRVASVSRRSQRYVRNERFREWSAAAQPAGLPDEIVVNVGAKVADRARLVSREKADWTKAMPGEELQVRPIDRSQLHLPPVPAEWYLVLNTTRPPFDDVRARRAVNYALDRSKVVRLAGGPESVRPTCQVLPPNFPGHSAYCPYTLDPGPRSAWTAPDVLKAMRLVRASGTAGAAVVLWWPTAVGTALGRYFEELLDSLGYRAQLRLVSGDLVGGPDAYFPSLGRRARDWQAAAGAWIADYPAASTFINLLSCKSNVSVNYGRFCNGTIEAKIRRALKVQEHDPSAANELWEAIDREITDQAPWVFLYTLNTPQVVSKRVGNFQQHPLWGPLFGQFWVR
jgi:YVTN family beta-propeller protein